ncbi:MAG TPA: RcpC/CpaB family pilus assembly protein [Mycobacteriales bacterium]|nr:RcpC/CpaB family pilus assembly protein [Mycobacteriales bacterium]
MTEPSSPAASRLRQPRWLDGRLVAGVLLLLVSVVVGANVVRAADKTVLVWKSARALPVGMTLTDGDVIATRVRLFGADQARYLDARHGARPAGRLLARDIGSGELLPASALADAGDSAPTRLVAVPILRSHAVGGRLVRGDRVDVIATFRISAQVSETRAIVKAALIEEVVDEDDGFGSGDDYAVTLRVAPAQALLLASALQTAELDLLLVQAAGDDLGDVGDRPVSGGATRTTSADPSAAPARSPAPR